MKKTLIILSLAVITSCALPMDLIKLDETSKVVTAIDTKENLFVKSNLWLVDSFVSAKSVIQYSDKESGVIAGKFIIRESDVRTGTESIDAIIKIFVDDNKARISIKPLPYNQYERYGTRGQNSKEMAQNQIDLLIASFEGYLNKEMY